MLGLWESPLGKGRDGDKLCSPYVCSIWALGGQLESTVGTMGQSTAGNQSPAAFLRTTLRASFAYSCGMGLESQVSSEHLEMEGQKLGILCNGMVVLL